MPDLDVLRSLGADLVPPPFEVLRDNARRRRRRTRSVALATLAVAVVAVASGVWLVGRPHEPVPAAPVDDVRPLTYADGTVVHLGDLAVSFPGVVVELDLTDAGAVVRTYDGRIWFTDGSSVEQVGALGEPGPAYRHAEEAASGGWVVSGNTGALAAWFEFPAAGSPVLVAFDTTSSRVVARAPLTVRGASWELPASVDEQAAYWSFDGPGGEASRGRLDLGTAGQRTIATSEYAAARATEGAPRTSTLTVDGRRVTTDGTGQQFDQEGGRLEPLGGDEASLSWDYQVPSDVPVSQQWFLVQWVDDDTVVLRQPGVGRIDLLTCRTSDQQCEPTKRVPGYAVLPDA